MIKRKIYLLIKYCTAIIWLINGLYCKVLNFVPRHQLIVERILKTNHGMIITKLIGISEIAMFLWIISGYKTRINAVTQVAIIGIMNLLEFLLAPDLLLWGRWNALFAFLLILVIASNEFVFHPKASKN